RLDGRMVPGQPTNLVDVHRDTAERRLVAGPYRLEEADPAPGRLEEDGEPRVPRRIRLQRVQLGERGGRVGELIPGGGGHQRRHPGPGPCRGRVDVTGTADVSGHARSSPVAVLPGT